MFQKTARRNSRFVRLSVEQLEDRSLPSVTTNFTDTLFETPLGETQSINKPVAYYTEVNGTNYTNTLNSIATTNPSGNWVTVVASAFPTWTFTVVNDPANLVITARRYVAYGDRYVLPDGTFATAARAGEVHGDLVMTTTGAPAGGTYKWIQVFTTNYDKDNGFVNPVQNALDVPQGATTPYYSLPGVGELSQEAFMDQASRPAVSGINWSAEAYLVRETAANTVEVYRTGVTWAWYTRVRDLTDVTVPTVTASSDPNPSGFQQAVAFTADVTTTGNSIPTGNVTFINRSNGQIVGRESVANLLAQPETSRAILANADVRERRNKITTIYSGDADLAGTVGTFWHAINLPVAVPMNASLTLSEANSNVIHIAEVDEGDIEIQVTLAVNDGTLNLAGTTGLNFTFSDGYGEGEGDGSANTTMTFRGTMSAIRAALDGLVFTPDYNFTGTAYLQMTTSDLGNTEADGPLGDDEIVEINVIDVNDAPTGADNTITAIEDAELVLTRNDFGFSDPNDSDAFLEVIITTLPTSGTLKLDGVAITEANTAIRVSDIDNELLTFAPAANANGAAYSTFTFQVRDNGGTECDGVDTDPTPRTMTIDVTAVNDAPVITSNGGGSSAEVNAAENQTAVTTVTSTDLEGDTRTYSITGGADAAKFEINSSTGALTFVAAPNFEVPTDADTDNVFEVSVQVSDGNGGTDTQDIAVTVTNVNDAPTNISLSSSSVDENLVSGTTVGTLSATDDDSSSFTFSLVEGTGDTDNASFTIVGDQLRTAASFDYETKASYSIRVQATDAGDLSFEKVLTITVGDVDATIWSDTFTDTDETGIEEHTPDVGAGYFYNSSTLQTIDNALGGGGNAYFNPGTTHNTISLDFTLANAETSTIGCIIRFNVGSGNAFCIGVSGTALQIYEYAGGYPSLLTSETLALSSATQYTLTITDDGDNIIATIGSVIASTSSTTGADTYTTMTVGIGSADGTSIDNLLVTGA